MEEIENSKLVREELIRQDLSLASASSFLSVVCGGSSKEKGVQKIGEAQGRASGSKVGAITPLTKEQLEAKYLEKKRVTRIVAAKSLLEEELAKAESSWALVATFCVAAGDGEESCSREVVDVHLAAREGQPAKSDMPAAVNTQTTVAQVSCTAAIGQFRTIPELQAEATSVIPDDAPMSIGDSEEEGSESGGDESPEREPAEMPRRVFPGLITRSEGGCWVYVPPTERTYETDETCATDATPGISSMTTTDEAPPNDTTNATCVTDAMSATATEITVGATIATVATGTACAIDVATSGVATRMNLTTTGAFLVPTGAPTRDQSGFEMDATCSTSLVSTMIPRSSTPEPDTVVLYPVSEPTALFQAGQIHAMGTPISRAEEVVSNLGGIRSEVMPNATAGVMVPLATERWGRDAQIVEGLFQILEGMEPPWITVNVLEAAAVRFPNVDRESLRLTIMTMMMTQRRCLMRLTRAGLRRGPRIYRDGNFFIELDLDYADRYSTSH